MDIKEELLNESRLISKKVLKRLNELNWTQVQLAKALGMTPQGIYPLISGRRKNIRLETLIRLQKVLGIALLASYNEKTKRS